MAEDNSGSNTGIVAIVVIFLVVLILGFLAFRSGMFGGRAPAGGNVNVTIGTDKK